MHEAVNAGYEFNEYTEVGIAANFTRARLNRVQMMPPRVLTQRTASSSLGPGWPKSLTDYSHLRYDSARQFFRIISRIRFPPTRSFAPILLLLLLFERFRLRYQLRKLGVHLFCTLRIWPKDMFTCSFCLCKCQLQRPNEPNLSLILMSIWIAVIPSSVPATLKSMRPKASSRPGDIGQSLECFCFAIL